MFGIQRRRERSAVHWMPLLGGFDSNLRVALIAYIVLSH